jgi:hypothetical protein
LLPQIKNPGLITGVLITHLYAIQINWFNAFLTVFLPQIQGAA